MTDVKMLPKDFLAGMKELLGKEYDQYIKSYEEEWKPGLRVNLSLIHISEPTRPY